MEGAGDSALVARVRESNRQAAGARARWAGHRARVMAVLDEAGPGRGALALLGAGHLHDVELPALLGRYGRIALADLDPGPVTAAVAAVAGAASRCRVHAPVDLTGALHLLERPGGGPGGMPGIINRLASASCHLPDEPFDLTVSLGVLTQLMQAVTDAGVGRPDVPRLSLAVRDKHLRDLVRLTKPGGTLVLVTDFVSTASAPGLASLPDEALEPALASLVADGNFFTGTNPWRLVAMLEDDAPWRDRVARPRFIGPWWWRVTPDRQHLTGAIVAERRRG